MTTNGHAPQKRVAILIEQKVEDSEFQIPYNALKRAGAEVVVVGSRMNEEYKGKQGKVAIKPDATATESRPEAFDAVIIPGGMAPDSMRTNMKMVRFVSEAMHQGKLIAAICHGPQVLIEGDLLKGKQATGFRAIRKDMHNAGAEVIDAPLAVDGNLITSRRPGDLPIFVTAILTRLGLTIPDTTLPAETDVDAGWWKLAEEWGGSTRMDIVNGINIAIGGEKYGLEAFDHYSDRTQDTELKTVFEIIRANKQQHIQRLEARLSIFGERESFRASASSLLANLKSVTQAVDDVSLLRYAIGDLQTGVVDTYRLRNTLTDPATVAIFDDMEVTLAHDEQRLADLYRARLDASSIKPPNPTTSAAVSS
ncbi:MAG: DJ-1/PfpI/YhbO family deglycase/protease [Leptolyngbyaceae cyanobacterium bins.59]|nr:DJ-1/PfpI/YhbO family deglycase/protease [Leptolyngbyaceae cyanobacterium bins.59]